MENLDEQPEETIVPGFKRWKTHIGFNWGPGDLLLYETQYPDTDNAHVATSDRIYFLCNDDDLYSPVLRKLFNESHGIFVGLQKSEEEETSSRTRKAQLVRDSKNYRSVLRACMQEMHKVASSTRDGTQSAKYNDQVSVLSAMELCWNLCEILFIEAATAGSLLVMLLDWIRLHTSDIDNIAEEVLQSENPLQHDKFWDLITGYVLQARMDEARQLLAKEASVSTSTRSMCRVLDDLLKKMPTFTTQTLTEFELKWQHWREECERHLQCGTFSSSPPMESICKVLLGAEDALMEKKDLMGTWYHFLVSQLLFTHPTVTLAEIHSYAQSSLDAFYAGDSSSEPLDIVLLAAFELDIHQVIKEFSIVTNNWWFVAHLTDLLDHCQLFQSLQFIFWVQHARTFTPGVRLWSLLPSQPLAAWG